jgi:hypothetical protein
MRGNYSAPRSPPRPAGTDITLRTFDSSVWPVP